MLEAIQEHWLGSFLLNVLGYALILVPAALLIRHWKKSPRVQRGQCITHEMSAFANNYVSRKYVSLLPNFLSTHNHRRGCGVLSPPPVGVWR